MFYLDCHACLLIIGRCQAEGQHCNMIVTQPRRIAATSVAERICAERKWRLGGLVGYQIAMNRVASEDTRLLFVTTGVLLEKLIKAKNMNQYTHVILDEVSIELWAAPRRHATT